MTLADHIEDEATRAELEARAALAMVEARKVEAVGNMRRFAAELRRAGASIEGALNADAIDPLGDPIAEMMASAARALEDTRLAWTEARRIERQRRSGETAVRTARGAAAVAAARRAGKK